MKKRKKNAVSKSRWLIAVNWIVSILVPIVLVLTSVRLMLSPVILYFEYNLPGFPEDRYGFTLEDRLYWSKITLDYLITASDISFLEDLTFSDGTPVYNARELRHMVDVKNAVRGALLAWDLSALALFVIGIWAWRANWLDNYKGGLARGGWLTVILLGSIIIFVIISFGFIFVAFHNVFFEPGTWMFSFQDTLIRLFPERFWRDIFLYVGGLSILGGLALGFGLRKYR